MTGLTRLEFSRAVLQRAMGFVPGDLNCLVKVPGNADIFEISFKKAIVLERFWNLFREGKDKTPLSNFDVEPLSDTENKVVTVQFYNEAVQDHDVSMWLGRYGLVKSNSQMVLDGDRNQKMAGPIETRPLCSRGGMSYPQHHHAGETQGRGVLSRHAQAVQELR